MRREVVRNFLNLPGIAGVALIDGRSRPYFCGVDQALNFQQKEALAQGIQQIIETTPPNFQWFEFQFAGYQVYIYKLDHGVILLVLTSSQLIGQDYFEAVKQLQRELSTDSANAVATFRLLVGNITLSDQSYWKSRSNFALPLDLAQSSSPGSQPQSAEYPLPLDLAQSSSPGSQPQSAEYPSSQQPHTNSSDPATLTHPNSFPLSNSSGYSTQFNLHDLLIALNQLSQFTIQYLGVTVTTNYWKSTCPTEQWLKDFQVDRSAQFSFAGSVPLNTILNIEQQRWIQDWVAAFINRCSKVIRDFPIVVEQRVLDDCQKKFLLCKRDG
jgi:hypothetical protein